MVRATALLRFPPCALRFTPPERDRSLGRSATAMFSPPRRFTGHSRNAFRFHLLRTRDRPRADSSCSGVRAILFATSKKRAQVISDAQEDVHGSVTL